tara:strand:- start:37 stop:603 length:567 start_codon:yes stop_codon:yes gene_type:complete
MSELNLTHSNGNKVKLTTPDSLAANKTFKLPDADVTTATFQIVPPVFRAIRSDYQVLSNNTDTVIEFDNDSSSVSFDSNGFFNTSTYRFTPTIAGYYQLTAQLEFSLNTGNNLFGLMIFKNGSEYLRIRRWNDGSNSNVNINITGIVPFNGSSDYAQVYGWQNSGGNITVFQGSGRSYFEGVYLRPLI